MTTTPQAALLSVSEIEWLYPDSERAFIDPYGHPEVVAQWAVDFARAVEQAVIAKLQATQADHIPDAGEMVTQEPVQAGELLPQGGLTNEQLREAFNEKLPGVVPSDRELTVFALGIEVGAAELADERRMSKMYFDERNSARDAWRRAADQREEARAALAARKPLTLTDIDGLAKVYAKTYSSPHHFSIDCEGIRKIINGIGLEVKP